MEMELGVAAWGWGWGWGWVGGVVCCAEILLLGVWQCLPFSVGRKHPYWTDEDLFLRSEKRTIIKAL